MSGVIERCWSRPAITDDLTLGRFAVKVRLAPDGSVEGNPDTDATLKTPADAAMAKSAVRAVLRCQPFTALRDSGAAYETWRDLRLVFDARP